MGGIVLPNKVRYPRYAGAFYADSEDSLKRQIAKCFLHNLGPGSLPKATENGSRKILGLICPHAGYMYSGSVAANAYYALAVDGTVDVFVILGPNHHGVGSGISIMDSGIWRTPLGDSEIDVVTARRILKCSSIIDTDDSAHIYEHSIEVQIPFLQYIYGKSIRFVPICFLMQDQETCHDVGESLAEALKDKNAVIIASTDMTHYERQQEAVEKDNLVIDAIKRLDSNLLYSVIESYNISACGYGPVAALLVAAKKMNVKGSVLLSHRTSGDITGDRSAVVGYAALTLTK